MSSNTFFWAFVIFQLVIDLYVASIVIFWVIQRRKYGTFNPLSPFQHRDLQNMRGVLDEFHAISQKAALLLQHLQSQRNSAPAKTEELKPEASAPTPAIHGVLAAPSQPLQATQTFQQPLKHAPATQATSSTTPPSAAPAAARSTLTPQTSPPVQSLDGAAKSAGSSRRDLVRAMLQKGYGPAEIRKQTGATQEEIFLIQALQ